jgi:hypothetical protein
MQLLSLKEESHNLITSTLKHIYGDDFEFGTIDDYKDKRGSMIKHSYWKEKGELVIRGVSDLSQIFADDNQGREKMYAMLKLENYGFEKQHALETITTLNNTDDCINFLYEKYFPYQKEEASETVMTDEERLHMIGEEFESLSSIFQDEIQEVEKNSIWQFKFRLDYLLKFSPSEVKKEEARQKLEMEIRMQEMQQLKLKKKKKIEVSEFELNSKKISIFVSFLEMPERRREGKVQVRREMQVLPRHLPRGGGKRDKQAAAGAQKNRHDRGRPTHVVPRDSLPKVVQVPERSAPHPHPNAHPRHPEVNLSSHQPAAD